MPYMVATLDSEDILFPIAMDSTASNAGHLNVISDTTAGNHFLVTRSVASFLNRIVLSSSALDSLHICLFISSQFTGPSYWVLIQHCNSSSVTSVSM